MLRRRANARNVSFRISLRWPIHIINPVDETNLSNNLADGAHNGDAVNVTQLINMTTTTNTEISKVNRNQLSQYQFTKKDKQS